MIRPLRRHHLKMWLVLAPLVVAGLVIAWVMR